MRERSGPGTDAGRAEALTVGVRRDAGMLDVRARGLKAARHVDGDLWEVRVDADRVIYRILFAEEGARGQVLLALAGFNKKTQKTPRAMIDLAKRRLDDWRRRGDTQRMAAGRSPQHRQLVTYIKTEIPLTVSQRYEENHGQA